MRRLRENAAVDDGVESMLRDVQRPGSPEAAPQPKPWRDNQTVSKNDPQLLADLFERGPHACIVRRADDTIVAWNAAAVALYQYSAEEALGAPCDRLLRTEPCIAPDTTDGSPPAVQGNWSGRLRRVARDGTELFIEARRLHFVSGSGEELVIETTHAPTALTHFADELQSSHERFTRSFRTFPVGLLLARASDHVIVEVSDAFLDIVGWSRNEVLGRTGADLEFFSNIEFLNHRIASWRDRGLSLNERLEIADRAGARRILLVDAQIIEIDHASYVLAMIRDITKQEHAAAELHAAHELTRQVIACAHEGILMVDRSGRIRVWNRILEQLTGLSSDAALGSLASRLFGAKTRSEFEDAVRRALAGESTAAVDQTVQIERTHRTLWLRYRVAPCYNATQEVAGAIVTINDITQRRRLEQQLITVVESEKLRISQDLHDELGQEMTAISLLLDVARAKLRVGDPGTEAHLACASQQLATAQVSLRGIVRGLFLLAPGPDGLQDALARLVRTEQAATRARLRFDCPRAVRVPDPMMALQLFRIAQEACNNALKHSGASRITIRLRHERGQLMLTVTDNGRGLGQGDPAKFRGLHIMRYRAESLDGRLHITAATSSAGVKIACTVPLRRRR